MSASTTDLLVVGGGPVGLVTALYARRAGLRVTVLEPRAAPVDKACGEGVMPSALARLRSLGVDPDGHPIAGIAYTDGTRRAEARFAVGPGRGVRRTVLQPALLDAARDAGVEMVPGAAADIEQGPGWVRAGGVTAAWLAAADGLHSPARRRLGLDVPARGRVRFGLRRHVRVQPWTDLVEVHWAPDAECYVTPVADDVVGIAMLTSERGRSWSQWLTAFPVIARRVEGCADGSDDRGAGPLRQRASRLRSGRVLLVGDAAGYVDALTGEGLAAGFAQAEELVRAVESGRPESYDRAAQRVTRRSRTLTVGLLAATSQPWVRRRLVPAAARVPRAFGTAVDLLA